jgi:IS1 family transposase
MAGHEASRQNIAWTSNIAQNGIESQFVTELGFMRFSSRKERIVIGGPTVDINMPYPRLDRLDGGNRDGFGLVGIAIFGAKYVLIWLPIVWKGEIFWHLFRRRIHVPAISQLSSSGVSLIRYGYLWRPRYYLSIFHPSTYFSLGRKRHKGSLDYFQGIPVDLVGIEHGIQLQSIDYGDSNASEQEPPRNQGFRLGAIRISHEETAHGHKPAFPASAWYRDTRDCFLLACWILAGGLCSRTFIRHANTPFLSLLLFLLLFVLAAQVVKSLLAVLRDYNDIIVTQKYLTTCYLCNTVIGMANVLSADKQTAIIAALAEGSSIRSIERITGVHRDTIMRLGVKVGKGCELLMDSKMQDLDCHYLQFDELWGFIGKKERHVGIDDNPELGDVWTFCAIDSETKLVPSFLCGKRNHVTANAFVQDVASRMRNRVQISTDALNAYVEAVEQGFGSDVDYGQIVKVYVHDAAQHPERKYSAPSFASAVRRPISGDPERELISTSHVERLNATTRLHVKRLNRLTLAFSKKLENFKAAVALHFAYYNFVRRHNTLRCTPAMAAGIENDFWTVGDLVEATS